MSEQECNSDAFELHVVVCPMSRDTIVPGHPELRIRDVLSSAEQQTIEKHVFEIVNGCDGEFLTPFGNPDNGEYDGEDEDAAVIFFVSRFRHVWDAESAKREIEFQLREYRFFVDITAPLNWGCE